MRALKPTEKLKYFGIQSLMLYLSEKEMDNIVPNKCWPLPILKPNYGVEIRDDFLVLGDIVRLAPRQLYRHIAFSFSEKPTKLKIACKELLKKWNGKPSIALSALKTSNISLDHWRKISHSHISKYLTPVNIYFLKPPFEGMPPLSQMEFKCVAPDNTEKQELVEQIMDNPLALDQNGVYIYHKPLHHDRHSIINEAIPFKAPFDKLLIGFDSHINLNHPITINIIKALCAINLHHFKRSIKPAIIGQVHDELNIFKETIRSISSKILTDLKIQKLNRILSRFFDVIIKSGVIKNRDCDKIKREDFPNLFFINKYWITNNTFMPYLCKNIMQKYLRNFGDHIKELSEERMPQELIDVILNKNKEKDSKDS